MTRGSDSRRAAAWESVRLGDSLLERVACSGSKGSAARTHSHSSDSSGRARSGTPWPLDEPPPGKSASMPDAPEEEPVPAAGPLHCRSMARASRLTAQTTIA